jgi:alkylation response protein AidB-like acyl-CoA dehydrogenase
MYDQVDPLEKEKDEIFAQQGIIGRAVLKAYKTITQSALEYLELERTAAEKRDQQKFEALQNDKLVQFLLQDSVANVLCPAAKLWNTGVGSVYMREAVSLMGGYGITEDCPGFLGHKWMDSQLEATYEGPEAVQRRNLSVTMTNELFLAQWKNWIEEMRQIASKKPGTGACTLATAMKLWLWTYNYLQNSTDADGNKLYHGQRQGVCFPLADALSWLLAAREFLLDTLKIEEDGPNNPVVAEGLEGTVQFYYDLCHVQAARAAGEAGRICAELVFGYRRHPEWPEGCAAEKKAGPCAQADGAEEFLHLRNKLDRCLSGSQLAKDRAAESLAKVMIPEALDYPR